MEFAYRRFDMVMCPSDHAQVNRQSSNSWSKISSTHISFQEVILWGQLQEDEGESWKSGHGFCAGQAHLVIQTILKNGNIWRFLNSLNIFSHKMLLRLVLGSVGCGSKILYVMYKYGLSHLHEGQYMMISNYCKLILLALN
jgi:hypothetical protein